MNFTAIWEMSSLTKNWREDLLHSVYQLACLTRQVRRIKSQFTLKTKLKVLK